MIHDDVRFNWVDAIAHRLVLPVGAAGSARRAAEIAGEVLESVRPPRLR